MTELLSVPLKKPTDLDLVRPLVNLIKSSYNNLGISKLSEIEQSISKFNQQRNASVWKAYEKSENSLELYYTYYDQLSALETKIIAQDLQVPFKWKDAFDKGSIFGGRMSLSTYCLFEFALMKLTTINKLIHYELLCFFIGKVELKFLIEEQKNATRRSQIK